jgi:hypothetical protein
VVEPRGMGIYAAGTLIKRGRIWYYPYFDNGRNRMVSSKSERRATPSSSGTAL